MPAVFATIFLNGALSGSILWIGISAAAVLVVLFLLLRQLWFVVAKKRKYVSVDGTVVLVEEIPDHSLSDFHSDTLFSKGPRYRFGISFTTLEGQTFDLVCTRYSIGFEHVKYGDIVNVYYHPADPKKFYAELKKPRFPKLHVYRTGLFD